MTTGSLIPFAPHLPYLSVNNPRSLLSPVNDFPIFSNHAYTGNSHLAGRSQQGAMIRKKVVFHIFILNNTLPPHTLYAHQHE